MHRIYIFGFLRWTHGCTRFNYNGVEAIIVAGGRISAGRGDELNSAEILGKTLLFKMCLFYFIK